MKRARLLDLYADWNRLADEYDAQAVRHDAQADRMPNAVLVGVQLRAWAQAYRNAAAWLALSILPAKRRERARG